MVPLTSSRISQGDKFYSQEITFLCICALLTGEEITAIFLFQLSFCVVEDFLGWGSERPPWQWHFQSLLLGTLAGEGALSGIALFLLSLSWGRF